MKRRSDSDIITFISELPGGNVPQYAKLLNTTAIRLNTLMHSDEGQKLARKGSVVISERGMRPKWATSKTARGCLRARDVDNMVKTDTLPPFIAKLLESVHPTYRDDSLNFLREALEQTANHASFEDQMRHYLEQDKDRTDQLVHHEERIRLLEKEASTFEFVLMQAKELRNQVELLSGSLQIAAPKPSVADVSADADEALAAA